MRRNYFKSNFGHNLKWLYESVLMQKGDSNYLILLLLFSTNLFNIYNLPDVDKTIRLKCNFVGFWLRKLLEAKKRSHIKEHFFYELFEKQVRNYYHKNASWN